MKNESLFMQYKIYLHGLYVLKKTNSIFLSFFLFNQANAVPFQSIQYFTSIKIKQKQTKLPPSFPWTLGSAPRLRSSFTVSVFPLLIAACKAVKHLLPFVDLAKLSIWTPALINTLIISLCPLIAACCSGNWLKQKTSIFSSYNDRWVFLTLLLKYQCHNANIECPLVDFSRFPSPKCSLWSSSHFLWRP